MSRKTGICPTRKKKKNDGHDNSFTRELGVLRKISFGFISAIRLIANFSIIIETYSLNSLSFKCEKYETWFRVFFMSFSSLLF